MRHVSLHNTSGGEEQPEGWIMIANHTLNKQYSESQSALEGNPCIFYSYQACRQQRINEPSVTILLLKSSSAVKSKDSALH